MFTTLNSIGSRTSDRSLESVRDNGIVRLQYEAQMNAEDANNQSWKSIISSCGRTFQGIRRSVFDLSKIDYKIWQCHLERIVDYLLPGEGVWLWLQGNQGEFFDSRDDEDSRDEGPELLSLTKEIFKSSS